MTQITKYSSVKGSLQSVANKQAITVAQAFVDAETIVLLDVSASMTIDDDDAHHNEYFHFKQNTGHNTRFRKACNQLAKLQAENPGKVALVCFDDRQTFEASGIGRQPNGSTDIAGALSFVHKADGTGMQFVLISDGEPDDEQRALDQAKRFKSKISTIYIGPENGQGADFLRRLSAVTGGQFSNNGTAGIVNLSATVERLLTA